MYDITIIGCGITGMLVLAILQQHSIDLSKVCIIDPYFDGGNLLRSYGSVISNTPLSKTVNALKLIDSNYTVPEKFTNFELTSTTPLWVLTHLIKTIVNPILKKIDTVQSNVQSIDYTTHYKIQTDVSQVESKIIILCQGAEPKMLHCDIPIIPLTSALNEQILKNYLSPNNKVLVFGTSHSGCIILENLHKLNIETIAVHKSKAPFLFARDGEYDGIKEEAERIAHEILENKYNNLTLLHINEIDKIIKASKQADYVVYCIGFETTNTIKANFDITKYDSTNGRIKDVEKAYGFGIAYPSAAPDGIHVDVGIISFVEHIQNQIEDIKKLIN
jgi:thioredoxin reductase